MHNLCHVPKHSLSHFFGVVCISHANTFSFCRNACSVLCALHSGNKLASILCRDVHRCGFTVLTDTHVTHKLERVHVTFCVRPSKKCLHVLLSRLESASGKQFMLCSMCAFNFVTVAWKAPMQINSCNILCAHSTQT